MASKTKRVFVMIEVETDANYVGNAKDLARHVKEKVEAIPGVLALQTHANVSKPERPRTIET